MVCDQTDGNVCLIIFSIFLTGNLAYKITKRTDGIYVKNGIHILNNNRQSFKSHSCINIFILKCFIIAVSVIFKLGKYIVPHFNITVALAAYGTVRFAAAVFFTAVIINLRAWTAGACAVLPEVILFAKTENTLSRNTDLFVPDLKSLVILQIYRRIQTLRIKSHNLCQELPGPCNGFMFKIIAKGKVSEHLKESAVAGSFSHVFNITGTDAFLAGCHSCSGRNLCSGKIWL